MKTKAVIIIIAFQLWLAGVHAATFTVTTTNDAGAGSLRQAITDANATPGRDTIAFNIKESVPVILTPATGLPPITEALLLDGWSQPDATTNTLRDGFNSVLGIHLEGSLIAGATNGLHINADDCEIRGLGIHHFPGNGIYFNSGTNHQVRGNYIFRNDGSGIILRRSVANVIGDGSAAGRNVISGNNGHGVYVYGSRNESNLILGNFIGVDTNGVDSAPNAGDGIQVNDSALNTIGDPEAEVCNVISGNDGSGVVITNAGSTDNLVVANLIGTDVSGVQAVPNGRSGVRVFSSRNQIGGDPASGEGNVIAFNARDGITVVSGTNVAVRANFIYANDGLGIDLGGDDVTANDAGDTDTGANQLQNHPVLLTAQRLYPQVLVQGRLDSKPSTSYAVEFFLNTGADPTGFGEGEFYLGATNVTTDAAGTALFSRTLNITPPYGMITATATDPTGNTSEFSPAIPVGQDADVWLNLWADQDYAPLGSNLTALLEVGNAGAAEALNVVVSNTPPAGFTPVSMTVSKGTWANLGGTLVWTVGDLASNQVESAQIVLQAVSPGYNLMFSSASAWSYDSSPENTAGYWLSAGSADVGVAITAVPDPVVAGQTLTLHFTATNRGPQTAAQVSFWGAIGATFVFQSVSAPFGSWSVDSYGYLTWDVGDLPANAGGTLVIVGIPSYSGTLPATANCGFDGVDSESTNNWLYTDITVLPGSGVLAFNIASASVLESSGTAELVVNRTGGDSGTVTVQYHTTPGTAQPGGDYTPISGTLTFTNGETAKTLLLPVLNDSASECNETLTLNLFNPAGGAVLGGWTNFTLAIADNDTPSAGDLAAASVTPGVNPVTGNGQSDMPFLSADGRRVAFRSYTTDLATNDFTPQADVLVRDLQTGQTLLASVNQAGTGSGDGDSFLFGFSADGHRVLFNSYATDLVPNDTNFTADIFVRDLRESTNRLVSTWTGGATPGNSVSQEAVMTPDGRYVVFASESANLTASDWNETQDVFRRDLATGTTLLVSRSRFGSYSADGWSGRAVVSSNGQFVAFASWAPDLAPNDNNGRQDIFLRDVNAGTTALVSINAAHTGSATGYSQSPAISPDGRFVAFMTSATNVVPGGLRTNGLEQDLVIYDRLSGSNRLVCSTSDMSRPASFSADSQYLVFYTPDPRLAAADTNQRDDVFSLALATGHITLVSVNCGGNAAGNGPSRFPAVSADGRYITFTSSASDLAPAFFPTDFANVFLRDLATATTTLISLNTNGHTAGNDYSENACINADGGVIAFASRASDLFTSDFNSIVDVFVWNAAPAAPQLTIARSNTVLRVSWPASAASWMLERTNALRSVSSPWPPVPPPYQTNGGVISVTVTNTPAVGNQFFRLYKPRNEKGI